MQTQVSQLNPFRLNLRRSTDLRRLIFVYCAAGLMLGFMQIAVSSVLP